MSGMSLGLKIQASVSVLAGFVSFMVGPYSMALGSAAILSLIDFFVGYLVALYKGENCTWKASAGLIKKGALLFTVIAFYWVGKTTGMDAVAIFMRDTSAVAIAITEFVSIMENLYNSKTEGKDRLLPERIVPVVERFVDVRFADITGREPLYRKVSRIEKEIEEEDNK